MVRAVVVIITLIFSMAVVTMIAGAALEPLADEVKSYDEIDKGDLNGSSVVDSTLTMLLEYAPVVVIGGMTLWGVVWYLRKERVPRGGGNL
jgi:hypothetical protein